MAIRFQCVACLQPIEVDDEWALKAVACPYCRRTVSAPSESTLDELSRIPVASKLSPVPVADGVATRPYPVPPPVAPAGTNRIAAVALVLGLLLLGAGLSAMGILRSNWAEVMEFAGPSTTFQESVRRQSDFIQSRGGVPPNWMIAFSLLMIAAVFLWMATVVCGAIGLRGENRRTHAVIALIIAAAAPFVFCCGVGISGAGG